MARRESEGDLRLPVPDLDELPSRRNQITDTLRAAITAGDMRPGTVYSAPALASEFGVSPTPVREAMLHLSKEGLIEVVRNKGFRVMAPSERDLAEILELRLLVEVPTVAKIAARGASTAVLKELDALAESTVRAARAGDYTEHVRADLAFHTRMLALAENKHVLDLVINLRRKTRLFGLASPVNSAVLISSSEEHATLVDLVRRRRGAEARKLMRQHIEYTRDVWALQSDHR